MFDFSPKTDLSGPDTLDLVELLLKTAQESDKKTTQLALCGHVDTYLGTMKKFVKRPSPSTAGRNIAKTDSNEDEQLLRQRIAKAYHDHADLLTRLDHLKMAQESERREGLWSGLVTAKTVASAAKTVKPDVVAVTVPAGIFPVDYRPFSTEWSFPAPDDRVSDTPQLVSCLGLLKQASVDLPDDALDPEARKWLKDTARNQEEKTRLETLATDIVRAFTQDEIKDEKAVTEVLCLAPVLKPSDFRFLLKLFVKNFNESPLLDFGAVRGVAQLLRSASPGQLLSDDLIKVLEPISARLQATHTDSPENIFKLTVAVSSVLDAMADSNVRGLNRVEMHEPLLLFLGGLRKNDDPHLKFLASYVFQALLCVPNDESSLQAAFRRTNTIVRGISGLVTAVKSLDLNAFVTGLKTVGEGLDGVLQVWESGKNIVEGFSAIHESEQDILVILKEAFTRDQRRPWYRALRGADILLNSGELTKFRALVCEAVCRLDAEFQWGICQRLGDVAANPRWDMDARQGAVSFLEEIYRNDLAWGHLPPIKRCILAILKNLSVGSKDLPEAASLLESLGLEEDPIKKAFYKDFLTTATAQYSLTSEPLEVAPSALIDRVQKRMKVDRELRQMFRRREKERDGAVFVPPMAKSSLQASDESAFPLIPEVDAFLKSKDKKVLLLLGDSGVGKTTFNRQLDLRLWEDYMKEPKTSRIPLLISLPAIERPERDLIAKHLRLCEFNESQIAELKRREFVIICDGYDESQQSQNLYTASDLNQENGWKAQMIISCRSERLGEDYRDLFQPPRQSPSDPDSFMQAVLVPFSGGQVKQYITDYVRIKKPLWEATDYSDILQQIPSLQELVKNPFLLTLTLEVLPRLADPGQTLTTNKITRVQLYDEFVAQWLERNKKKLGNQALSDQEKEAFESLSDDGFTLQGLIFLQRLSVAIYKEQRGNPVVDYSKARDMDSWKEEFFGRKDGENRLLRKALPLTRYGTRFGFIHRSILEYGVSRAIYEPQKQGIKLQAVDTSNPRRSMESTLSFEDDEEKPTEKPNQADDGLKADSPLAKRSFVKDTSVIQFLAERVEQEPVFRKQLQDYLDASKKDKKWRIAAANAITILIRAGVRFSHENLRGIRVPGADLSFGVFDSAQLQEADLRKANLQNVWLRQADLTQARMYRTRFGEWPTLSETAMSHAFAYAPDGKTFFAGTKEGKILVYNTATWVVITTLEGHDRSVTDIFVSLDGSLLASGADDLDVEKKVARIWDVKSGKCLHVLDGHTEAYTGLIFSPSGHRIITGSRNQAIYLWDLETGDRIHSFEVPGNETMVDAIDCSPDWQVLASAYEDQSLRIWNVETSECLRVLTGLAGFNLGLAYSPNGERFSLTTDEGIKTWDAATGDHLWTFNETVCTVGSAVYSLDSKQIACGTKDNTASLLDPVTGKMMLVLRGHTAEIYNIAFSQDGLQIATASEDRTVRLWSQKGEPGAVFNHLEPACFVKFSPSGLQIATSSEDKSVRLFDTRASKSNTQPKPSYRSSASVHFICGQRHYIFTYRVGWIRVWERQSGALVHCVTNDQRGLKALFPCDPKVALSGYEDTTLLWAIESGQARRLFSLRHTDGYQHRVAISSGDRIACTTGVGSEVKVWNRSTGTLEHHLLGHKKVVNTLLFSPNGGQQLASHSDDESIRLWDMSTGLCTATLEAQGPYMTSVYSSDGLHLHTAFVNCSRVHTWDTTTGTSLRIIDTGCENPLVYSPDGRIFVAHSGTTWRGSGSNEGTLQVWDMVKGERLWTLGKTIGETAAAVSPDGQLLATSSQNEDGAVILWDLKTGQPVAKTENYRGNTNSVTMDFKTASEEEAQEGKYVLSMAASTEEGDVSLWKLMEHDSPAQEGSTEQVIKDSAGCIQQTLHNHSYSNNIGERVGGKTYKFVMQWSTAFGGLNAAGASIEGVEGLSLSNTRLLQQNGACGQVVSSFRFRRAVGKLMGAQKVFSRLGPGTSTTSQITGAEEDKEEGVEVLDRGADEAKQRVVKAVAV